jgi:endonuclease-8
MPEGDTVYLAARNLDAAIGRSELTVSDFRVPRYAELDLTGRTVDAVVSRGKHLLFRFSGARTLHTHFRMDGSWHLYRPGEPWKGGPDWQVRAVLGTSDWRAVGYRLPVLDVIATSDEDTLVGHLGPDLLGPDWDQQEAEHRLRAAPDRAIGAALLDQRNLAGLGNLYRTEVCFLAGVSPWTPVGEIADLPRLLERSHTVISANKDRWLQVTTGDSRRDRWHWVFERSRCLRCGTRVSTALQDSDGSPVPPPGVVPRSTGATSGGGRSPGARSFGAGRGNQRVTYWCPTCQPGPAPRAYPVRMLLGSPTVGRTRYSP